jgi:hypothetical protein
MSISLQDLMHHRDYKKMQSATQSYLADMSDEKILDYMDDAGRKALYDGDGSGASAIRALVNGPDAYGEHLRWNAVSLLSDRPHLLKHFSADFANGIATRLT